MSDSVLNTERYIPGAILVGTFELEELVVFQTKDLEDGKKEVILYLTVSRTFQIYPVAQLHELRFTGTKPKAFMNLVSIAYQNEQIVEPEQAHSLHNGA